MTPNVPTEEFEAVKRASALKLILDFLTTNMKWLLLLGLLGLGVYLHILPRSSQEALTWIERIGGLFK